MLTQSSSLGSNFEQALYSGLLGGKWLTTAGEGLGELVIFNPDGSVQGLPGAQRYALCLAGDCAAMSGDNDSMWLQLGDQGKAWLFERQANELRILEAVNRAPADQIPDYRPGAQHWRLQLN